MEEISFSGTYLEEAGAGIFCDNSNLRLEDLFISNNTTGSSGGGIYSRASNLIIKNTTIDV